MTILGSRPTVAGRTSPRRGIFPDPVSEAGTSDGEIASLDQDDNDPHQSVDDRSTLDDVATW
jgi:hypothetical protein